MSNWEIRIKKVPPLRVASLMSRGLPFHETVPKAFQELVKWVNSRGISMASGSPMGLAVYYDDPKEVPPDEVRFKVAVPVSEGTEAASEGEAAVEMLRPVAAWLCLPSEGRTRSLKRPTACSPTGWAARVTSSPARPGRFT